MELISVACNNCGASLQVPESANFVTCNHCNSQLAVNRGENATYTEKIKEIDERTEEMQKELEQLRIENKLATLERNWEREKERYMVTDKHGHKSIPTTTGSIVGGVAVVAFGIFWTAMAAGGPGPSGFFPLFGIIFILLGIGVSVFSYAKAKDYLQAHRDYRRRRSALMGKKHANRRQR